NVAIGVVKGFDAFPLIDPAIVGDVTGNGSIGGLDASYVAQKSVGMPVSQIPDLPANVPVASGAQAITFASDERQQIAIPFSAGRAHTADPIVTMRNPQGGISIPGQVFSTKPLL
ncbi:MAG: hypothetical protein ACM359_17575, partial [Bacillota bacterium]